MSHKNDNHMIEGLHNTARFFVENRHVSWILLIATCIWGIYGYLMMPQRKDPEIPVRVAVALTSWPGASAEKIENLVTKKIEPKIAENAKVTKIESISRTGVSVVYLELDENIKDTAKELDDIKLRLDNIHDLPEGAGPINFIKDFGDTAALMLTVASPRASDVEISIRAKAIEKAVSTLRASLPENKNRFTIVVNFPGSINSRLIQNTLNQFASYTKERNFASDIHLVEGSNFIGLDGISDVSEEKLLGHLREFIQQRLQTSEIHPDVWHPIVIRDLSEIQPKLAATAGEKYTYREMDDFTNTIEKTLKTIPIVSKVARAGILNEKIFLEYSQERLASYGIQANNLNTILGSRNITLPGGQLQVEGKNFAIDPSGEFKNEKEIGDVVINSKDGSSLYLRDIFNVVRGYDSPAKYLNFFTWKDANGNWQRTRAITLSVQMRSGEKIGNFGQQIDSTLSDLKKLLPEDLIIARTSDQPLQVKENISLFMRSLYEAIILVVIVSLIGFWEWRSALLMALSIPITLLMTFGLMSLFGIDLQQISIATLIIALGLLVDDPVVAGDAIKRDLALGHKSLIAAWLGPTKLARAILYATITNIVAYVPLMLLNGDAGKFLYSLPIVMACSLVASRLVSMTFIPLLGYYLLKPSTTIPIEEQRSRGVAAYYYKIGMLAIEYRWRVLAASTVFLVLGGFFVVALKPQFFPKDLSYLSYVNIWLPEDAPLLLTNETARQAESIIRETVKNYESQHAKKGKDHQVLESLTTFVGGGGPRFWFSISPELQQLNYAQIIIQVKDKHDTNLLIEPLQQALSAKITGARVDVRQLESGAAVGVPVAVRISGEDIATLRNTAEKVKDIFRAAPGSVRVHDDWGDESFNVALQIDPDRANLAGISNLDVAKSSGAGLTGFTTTTLREGDKQIPVVARLRMDERAQLSDVANLYIYSSQQAKPISLQQVSSIDYSLKTEKLRRRNQFRTITVGTFPEGGKLPSEIMKSVQGSLDELAKTLPPGYKLEIGGEQAEQVKGFKNLATVMVISVLAIFLALVFQFKHAFKPLIVFAAIPYGMVGALATLWFMGFAFGFMAFLGIVSLIGVIISHVIVLFDFIEEKHEEGESLTNALLDAGIMRLRPVLITVGATVIALFPLASNGGPLWEPMCYAQIGGLSVATVVTLLLVPVVYAIFVLDLKLVKWDGSKDAA